MQMCLYEAVGGLLWSPGGPRCHHGRLCGREAETGHTGAGEVEVEQRFGGAGLDGRSDAATSQGLLAATRPGREGSDSYRAPGGALVPHPGLNTLYGVRRLQGRADSLLFHPVPLQGVTCQNAFLHWAARCLLQAPHRPPPCSSLLVPSQAAGWPLQLRPWLAAVTETRAGRDVGGGWGLREEGKREHRAGHSSHVAAQASQGPSLA